jgi:hypothetical protein
MPAISARSIGTTALRLLGVAAAEAPLSADMAQSALEALNTMLDSWSVEKLLTYHRPKIPLALVPGRASYTWGVTVPPSDIPREPPVRLELALLTVEDTAPGLEWEVTILDQSEYEAGIWMKNLTSSYPAALYLDSAEPVATLHVWPIPDMPYTLQLLPWQAHSPYGGWDDVLEWPAGYQRAMVYGLALELAPQYMVEPSPLILRTAEESKRALYPLNAEVGKIALWPGRPVGGSPLGLPRGFLEGTR